MPRRRLINQEHFPYHVTSRSNNRDWFHAPMQEVWEVCQSSLTFAYDLAPIELHAFVLMDNHYHMLLTTPDSNIDRYMWAFNKSFSEGLKKITGRINRMLGGPYKWTIVDSERYLYNVFRYIIQNPLRANIVNSCAKFPYSSFYYQINKRPFPVPLTHPLPGEPADLLNWVDQILTKEQLSCMRRGLKHSVFELKEDRNSRRLPKFDIPRP